MANKKINQLVSKTSILSTDLFGIGDATTGQLFKKTIAELQAAIGGAVISVNGLVGTVVLDTDDIQELATPTNKWFTDARARAAISLTVTGNSGASTYSSGTGVLNVPTYTLAGLGGITATFLSGGTGISYNSTTGVISYSGTVYTDASIRALFTGGTGITYNSTTGAISYSGTVYTDSSIRALISLTTTGNSGASTYNNTTGVINVPEYTLAGLGGISYTSLSGGTGISYNSTTGAISYSGTVYTDSSIRGLISATSPISYNSTTGVISLTSGNLTEATSSVLTITGGTGAVLGSGTSIQVKQATTSVSGFLSSTDWNTFNNKQGTITLTTTGTSGAATFSSGTLNIPNYGSALSGYLPLTGGTLTGALGGTSASFSSTISGTSNISVLSSSSDGTSIKLFTSNNFPLNGNGFLLTLFGNTILTNNIVFSGGAYKYDQTGAGASIRIAAGNSNDGDINFNTFASGTAGATATEVNRMIVKNNGNVGIGTSSPSGTYGKLSVAGGITILDDNNAKLEIGRYSSGASNSYIRLGASSNSLRITNNTDAADLVTFQNGGNVGINTTTPGAGLSSSYKVLEVNGTFPILRLSNSSSIYLDLVGDASATYIANRTNSPMIFTTNDTERMRITSTGNVGVGTSSTYSDTGFTSIYIGGSTGGQFIMGNSTGGGSNRYMQLSASSTSVDFQVLVNVPFTFWTNSAERGRITAGGNWLLGTTSDNGERLYVSGAIRATGTITANSDINLKKNLLKIENALEKVEQINGYTYEFKEDDSKRHAGVIAQEIQTVLPEIVNKGNDGILGVEYGNISALLIEAIKEQNIKIKNLETLLASK
jgi:hypothetical protein